MNRYALFFTALVGLLLLSPLSGQSAPALKKLSATTQAPSASNKTTPTPPQPQAPAPEASPMAQEMTPTNTYTQMAQRALWRVDQAQRLIESGNLKAANTNLQESVRLLESLQKNADQLRQTTDRPVFNSAVQLAEKRRQSLTAEDVWVPLTSSMSEIEMKEPGEGQGATPSKTAEKAMVYSELNLPVKGTLVHVQQAQRAVAAGQGQEGSRHLREALDGLKVVTIIESSP